MGLDDAAHQRKTEAHATKPASGARIYLVKTVKYSNQLSRRNTDTTVLDPHQNTLSMLVIAGLGKHQNSAALLA